MYCLKTRALLCCLISFAVTFAYPAEYQPRRPEVQPYDVTNDDIITESKDPLEVLLYRTVMQEIMDDLDAKKPKDPTDENKEANEITNKNSDDVLAELQALQSIIEEKQDGRWLDQIQDVEDLLPPNYHNATDYHTKVGDLDLDEKQSIDKTSNGKLESTWLSDIVQLAPDIDPRGPDFHCSRLNPCISGQYCFDTVEMSECRQCHVVGMMCIGDAQCCSTDDGEGALCVLGKCARNVQRGSPGTLCQTADDCQDGMCCSQDPKLLQRICKPLAKLNQHCSQTIYLTEDIVLVDDNDYYCPCEAGLNCAERQRVVYAPQPISIDAGLHCEKPRKETSELPLNLRVPPKGMDSSQVFDTLRQARLESEDDQRFDEVVPLVHKDSKKAREEPDDGPMM